ncbi:MAG TPA: DUF3078 domain-containing protein, partial [Bacteroidota bacterium]|nr:DUF3078 domain-containing protein [Bacteroidota bacterium]
MNKTPVLILALLLCGTLAAQQKTQEDINREKHFQDQAAKAGSDTTHPLGWTHTASSGLNLTQVSFKDWVAGGSNALAYTLWLHGESTLNGEKAVWTNDYKFAFGQARLADQGLRQTDDEIYFESLLIYKLGAYINPYVAATLRTQFAPGYAYTTTADSEVSKFFDPGYLTQSAGVAYRPAPEFTTRLGLGLREVVTSQFTQYARNPSTNVIKKVLVEGGLESVNDLNMVVAENIGLVARLELFAPLNRLDKIIVRNDYILTAKANKYITTNLT